MVDEIMMHEKTLRFFEAYGGLPQTLWTHAEDCPVSYDQATAMQLNIKGKPKMNDPFKHSITVWNLENECRSVRHGSAIGIEIAKSADNLYSGSVLKPTEQFPYLIQSRNETGEFEFKRVSIDDRSHAPLLRALNDIFSKMY